MYGQMLRHLIRDTKFLDEHNGDVVSVPFAAPQGHLVRDARSRLLLEVVVDFQNLSIVSSAISRYIVHFPPITNMTPVSGLVNTM